MKQFTFYSLYAELLDTLNDEERGKITRRMCKYMFGNAKPDELTDKKLRFLWSNIIECLETDKQAQSVGKTPKGLNRQMAHFTFYENFHEAMELMDDKQSGQYVKAIYGFMLDGKEPKLNAPVDLYFKLAKRKLELSKIRSNVGKIGGTTERKPESNYNTWKLCRMNLAIRGIDANLGQQNADSFHNDQHKSLKADYIMANPPFNVSDWGGERLIDDPRWGKYGIPPTGNANYAWILHILYHLAPSGTAGFVLANGSLSTSSISEYTIRKNLIEDDKIDCIVTLPGGLFSTTSIPVCLWFMSRNKLKNGHRDRKGEILFIDARNIETEPMEDSRTQRKLSEQNIDDITVAYHAFRNHEKKALRKDGKAVVYADQLGFCKIAILEEISKKDYSLTPANYVGITPVAKDDEPFEMKMKRLTNRLSVIMAESKELDNEIEKQLASIGWKI